MSNPTLLMDQSLSIIYTKTYRGEAHVVYISIVTLFLVADFLIFTFSIADI